MREEKADLRAQVYLMEKENKSLELMINSQQAQEYALKTHIQHLQDEIDHKDSVVRKKKKNIKTCAFSHNL